MRVADYLMHSLHGQGVRNVFTVTGRGSLFLTDALAKHEDLEAVCVHHEQAAAFAAVAYAEQTGGVGACLVSTGCASTNAITGVLSAWQDQVPVVFISGQHFLGETQRHTGQDIRTFGQQEADIISIVDPITKFAHMIADKEEVPEIVAQAIAAATTGRKGPVWLDVPLDLQSAPVKTEEDEAIPAIETVSKLQASGDEVLAVVDALRRAERPVVLIGAGVKASGSKDDLIAFVERWNIPVTYAATAPDTYGSSNALSIGSVGAMGCSRAGNFAVQNADLVLVLGNRLTSLTTGPDYCKFARDAKILVVDVDRNEHSKDTVEIDRFVHSDLSVFLTDLNQHAAEPVGDAWREKCLHWKSLFADVEPAFQDAETVDLYELTDRLSDALPSPSTIVTDSGLVEVIVPANLRFRDGVNCIHPASQGAMGFALPAAIGAHFGAAQPIVTIVGDGSIMMNLQELETIRYHKIPIKLMVINNNAYSIIRRRQKDLFRRRTIGTDPENGVSCPDFSAVAKCFDLSYQRIETPADLDAGLAAFLSADDGVLCEVMGRHDQAYIELGNARSEETRRFVRRPLEDQAPFLDRDLFLGEMLVEPIDQ